MRKFEIVADDFIKYGIKDIILPKRSTKFAAAYDFYSPISMDIPAGEIGTIWTNVKFTCNDDEYLMVCVRSSFADKRVCLANDVGIIDKDYYGNPKTDGNIGVKLLNRGSETFYIEAGDRIAQGIIMKYLTIDNEEAITNVRSGGYGSSGV